VILPKKNEKDLRDVPDEVRKKMKLVLVENMDQVLSAALRRKPKPLKPSPTTAVEAKGSTKAAATKTPVFPPAQPPAVA
jgi:ATP-dependent Lon protease